MGGLRQPKAIVAKAAKAATVKIKTNAHGAKKQQTKKGLQLRTRGLFSSYNSNK
jgi:hypothetical protein